ncbi:MAG TPA: FAD-dependent monooxygenase [Polyangiaceae bacterium]|nr:FAD-dependent monooxygenase [Polyangiaceae bacterium]
MGAPARDIVIVGGGPAGTTTALALVDAAPELASRVVLLERARYPREKPCAGALGARGDALLRAIGVEVDVPCAPVDGISFRGAMGEASASPGAIGRVVRRIEFDHALALAAAARGIEVRDGVRVEAIRETPAAALVKTSAGEREASVVVGCDGVGSVVRKALGLPAGELRAQVIEVDTGPAAGDRARSLLHFDSSDRRVNGYAWDFPTVVAGRDLWCRGIYHLRIGRGEDEGLDLSALLAERLRSQGLDPSRCINKRYAERGFEPAGLLARGRSMLVGEAAGIDPVTGEGIAQAIEFGVLAGRFLARALGGASRDGAPAVEAWQREVGASRLARDLRIRARLLGLYYGPTRSDVEALLAESPDALFVGGQHFAAHAYDWLRVGEVVARGASRWAGAWIARSLAR